MQAIQYQAYGDYQENRLVELERPQVKDGDVLVQMRTVGINPLDNTFRSGHIYLATPDKLPRVGGQTGAGVVVESRNPAYKAGDRVFVAWPGYGLAIDGTWREYIAAPAAALSPIPEQVNDDDAAAFLAGAGYLSGYLALTEFAKFKPGQKVLAPAIGSAVGMETVQVARRLGASMTISTASTTEKAERARAAGYEHVIDLSRESMKDGVLRITDGKGVDVMVDGVSGNLTGQALGSLAFGGTVVVVGYAGGRKAEVDITDIIWKGATIRGFTFSMFKLEQIVAARQALWGYLNEGALQPTIAKIFALSDAAEAVRYLIEERPFGRVLMQVAR
ncbi:quinone oxidoreductase family protein [Paraburkholderia caffeinilytica]|uniref:quinone oxidoreductase family protein n=1 Tax=Paraburkholderia caffeinilytica TaxID=1761016 RepID=UPI0038B830C3